MKILNFGSLNLDIVYSPEHIVYPGETISSPLREIFCGGKGLNQSLALARAGAQVFHAGCIGSDGEQLKILLSQSGVDTQYVRTLPAPSGHAIIQVDTSGQNAILIYGGANRLITPEFADEVLSAFSSGDFLVLQNEISCIPYIIEKATGIGMEIVFNPSPFDAAVSEYPLYKVTYIVLNETEGEAITGQVKPDDILSAASSRFPKAKILLTLGSLGSVYYDSGTSYRQDAFKTNVVDTTGAGDTFLGYFFAMLPRLGPAVALRIASKAAAFAVSGKGAANSIPYLSDISF